MTISNEAKATLEAGNPVFGAWALSMSPRSAEVLAGTDLDWVGIDMEHSPIDTQSMEELVRAVQHGGATPIIRVPSVEAAVDGACKHALDAGAGGVMVPGVEAAADARRAVKAASFPPAGERGVASTTRANRYGTAFDDYVDAANDETLVVVQLESVTAIDNAADILAVDGIDVAFVGENDLSASMGHPGQTDHEPVKEAVETVRQLAIDHGVNPGIAGRTPEDVDTRIGAGYRFFLLGADLTFVRTTIDRFLPEEGF